MESWALYSAFTKFALYLGALGATGLCLNVLLFDHYVSVRSYRKKITVFATLGLVAAVTSYLLRGASLVGDWSGTIDLEILGILWETSVGTTILYRLVGFVFIIAGMQLAKHGIWLAAIGGGLVLWSFTQIGHVADTFDFFIQLVLAMHLGAASFWVGVLIPLQNLATNPNTLEQAGALGQKFGQVAGGLIPTLILAGAYLTWHLVGNLTNMLSPYGLTLLAKLAGAAILLGLGAANKLVFVPALLENDPKAARYLVKIISAEWCMFLTILAATALLTSSFTPSATNL